jgi:CheY-like chemotaxis protein
MTEEVEPLKILVVDDNRGTVEMLSEMLLAQGWHVVSALSGTECLERVAEDPFDVVVLDIMMPDPNGFEVCRQLKASHPALPVVFLTALGEERYRRLGRIVSGDGYITKPVRAKELAQTIRRVAGGET